ncbi:glutathione S-transferase TCHQD [Momordica charantia]|uniref:Glutathione S-transferase TCHQD n=1 Tax=Momordica charantia TaxID=3673 RepID=A0A6J1E099_MOMCH|nr:glutathione S-transferase TCHQD [Momordica charantia]XP_022159585.1 glutathione S-transferase TCHQD [Momordica charantia]XP_022159594.1 glutathione S-transferase TCHQD [Momordica charantia]XP_022159602.1 glutathione S-transferase TCHQD [Momordica charantia]XP_022159608.1 glutathione S-transferase TCHQD [Momordica charantia]
MQLYHHPYSLDSQKVRLALEEQGIDYTSYHVNPITAKNMDSSFFKMNQSAKLPVFKNGSHIIFDTIEIIQYIERIAVVSSGTNNIILSSGEVVELMHKIQEWNPKFFTLAHIPEKYRLSVTKFIRRVVIARMAETPEMAAAYHRKLREAYETEDELKNKTVVKQSTEHLIRLLDEIELRLGETAYLAGEEFTMADAVFIPVLARLVVLNVADEYIGSRPNIGEYWILVQQRPSYKKVIGKYFKGWRKHKTLLKTWFFVHVRTLLRRY